MLRHLRIENFRCIETAELELDAGGTGIVGANASGKTSFLESLYFLVHGRSFRTAARESLLGPAQSVLRVVAHIDTPVGSTVAGVEYDGSTSRLRLGGAESGLSAIAEYLPLQVIDPGIHRLVEEGSARRRRQLDWGVFHVKHEFLSAWRRYQRALKQRNAALKAGHSKAAVFTWNRDVASAGQSIDAYRAEYAAALGPYFDVAAAKLMGPSLALDYRRGWKAGLDLQEALEDAYSRDQRLGTTTVGPHRADLGFKYQGVLARERVSRGQQKLLAAALILAQAEFAARRGRSNTCLLLDDPAAELDVDNLGKLLELVRSIPAQLIVTSVSEEGLKGVPIGRRFHVKQGRFVPVL